MSKAQKFILALSTSAVLALGAATPGFAGGPPQNPGEGTRTACEVAADAARGALGCQP